MITSKWLGPGEDISLPLSLRRQVFLEELGLPMEEEEPEDRYAFHLILLLNDVPVAAGRLSYGGVRTGKLSRICVLKRYRRQGIGDGLVKILDFQAAQRGMQYSRVEAPKELLPFYARIGYRETGEKREMFGMTLFSMQKETNDGTKGGCRCS